MTQYALKPQEVTNETRSFAEDIIIATDTFETSLGTVFSATNGLGNGDWLSPNIASHLAGDPLVPSQIQSTASLIPLGSGEVDLSRCGAGGAALGKALSFVPARGLPRLRPQA